MSPEWTKRPAGRLNQKNFKMKPYKTKKVGIVTNGDTITYKGHTFKVEGVWNNTKVRLSDQFIDENVPAVYMRGEVCNGTMYNAVLYVHKESRYAKKVN